jgi:replication factor A1
LNSIVLIAQKNKLDLRKLADGLIKGWRTGEYSVKGLKILCRQMNNDTATFLIIYKQKVLGQFPIEIDYLQYPKRFRIELQDIYALSNVQRKEKTKKVRTISELRCGMRRIDLKAKVMEIPPAISVLTRFGTTAYVSNIKIADESGSIRLSLWNNQVDNVQVGDEVELKACYVANYRGERQLRLGRKGRISVMDSEKDILQAKVTQMVN